MTVLAAGSWRNNAELIADVAELWIKPDDVVLDPTWGRGRWWARYEPAHLIRHDLYTLDGVDFRALPETDASVDVVAFDPPYVAMGGRTTCGLGDMADAYGMIDAPRTPIELREYLAAGVKECTRVLRSGGRLVFKCQDYISSGRYQPGTYWATVDATDCGLELVDRFELVGRPGRQPTGRRQVHARRNLSTALVFQA